MSLITTEAELVAAMQEAMDAIWFEPANPPELIYLPDIGVCRIDSEEARPPRYFRDMVKDP